MPVVERGPFQVFHEILNPAGERTVVMIHGLITNHTVFYRSGAQALAERGWRVVMFDLPGHGLSGPNPVGFRLRQMGRFVVAMMKSLGVARAALVGYSYGAPVAVQAALLAPEMVTGLVLIEAYSFSADPPPGQDWALDTAITASLADYTASTGIAVSDRAKHQVSDQIKRLAEAGVQADLAADAGFFFTDEVRALRLPVRMLYGKSSPYLADGQRIAEALHAVLRITKGDHNLPVTKAAWVSQRIVEFAAEQPPPAPDKRDGSVCPDGEPSGQTEPSLLSGAPPVIEVEGLEMSYGPVKAVKGISFTVEAGCFFAFLGANGAGKSSTINCLTTLLRPTGGTAVVAGHRLGKADAAIRNSIGVVFQASLLDPRLTVRENLALRARLHHIDPAVTAGRIEELAGLLGITSFIDRRYKTLSGGQRRRADIARALIHRPVILFLDEPTAGLDPMAREAVWQAIADVGRHEGTTIFLTTHYMAETERADMVYIIDEGRILAHGTPTALRSQYSTAELSLRLTDEDAAVRQLTLAFPHLTPTANRLPGDPLRLPVRSTEEFKRVLPYVWGSIEEIEYRRGSMEDVFLNLTGHRGERPDEPGDVAVPPSKKRGARR